MRSSRAVRAMNRIPNCDVFTTLANGGTPKNNANLPERFARSVLNVFPADRRALIARAVSSTNIRAIRIVP